MDKVGGFWDSRNHTHRNQLMRSLVGLKFNSVLDVGSNCGASLWKINDRFKGNKRLVGIDINKEALEEGKERFPRGEFIEGNAMGIPFKDNSFDLVLVDAVLIYIDGTEIRRVKSELLRVARKNIVLVEWHDSELGIEGSNDTGHWRRNYADLFLNFPVSFMKIRWGDSNWDKYGYVITVSL